MNNRKTASAGASAGATATAGITNGNGNGTAADSPAESPEQARLAELLAGLKALEEKAAVYDSLAKQIQTHEQVCLKDLAAQAKAVRSFIKSQQRAATAARKTSKHGDRPVAAAATAVESESKPIPQSALDSLDRKLQDMEFQFPRPPSLILRLALGSCAPFALRPLKLRIAYKRDYELFKLGMTIASTVVIAACLATGSRLLDAVYEFLMLYYYCTITLREHLLVVNGSRIRKWWLVHHYFSIILSGVVLIWPPSDSYTAFRPLFLWFCGFLCVLQVLQYRYQTSRLYALVALDKARPMDTVIGDGVLPAARRSDHTNVSVNRAFGFLTPFLVVGQGWQLYISWTLYELYVLAVAILFGVLGCGNLFVTARTVLSKRAGSLVLKDASPAASQPAFSGFKRD
ncbi:TMPIT-like protein [Entophlyctis helioformis]|nr:TMPIT-like protein [Entophlyctis helioformis]